MSILIGHASIDENGKAYGGRAGDQTGKEVCVRTWYNAGWNIVLRPKSPAVAEVSARACEAGCGNSNLGYDQWERNSGWDEAEKVNWDLAKITTPCETDCSAFMTLCARAAGINVPRVAMGGGKYNAPVTQTMRQAFSSTGAYEVLTDSKYLTTDKYLKRGDILVRESGHTAMALGNGELAGGSATQATTTPSTAAEIKAGDVVQFTGGTHYTSSTGAVGSYAKPGPAQVTLVAKGAKHPYHLIHTEKTSTVYGWVDAADIQTGSSTAEKTYTVAEGDTLWKIAQKYGTTVERLQETNGITGSVIRPGDILKIA